MAQLRVTTTAPPISAGWAGSPPVVCASCKFTNHQAKYFLEFQDVFAELGYDVSGTQTASTHPIVLCSLCVEADLVPIIHEIAPDDRMPKLQGQLLAAEAARARAEKRADKAEAALFAMQDWVADKPGTGK